MPVMNRTTKSFPAAHIASYSGGLPVQVTLIAQLGHGAGDKLFGEASALQEGHPSFVDALDEPSARLGSADFGSGETSTLFSFAVGATGHPFHRHAGHRVFTAISGSSGSQLRFSTASDAQLRLSPRAFVDALHHVEIPPDCLFTVRFGGGTWHQFLPLQQRSSHPALFAVSCHTNELAGIVDPALAALVAAGKANIPSLTETLPRNVIDYLQAQPIRDVDIPTLTLSLDAAPGSLHGTLCRHVRQLAGDLRKRFANRQPGRGFMGLRGHPVVELPELPAASLLARHFSEHHDHQDAFQLVLRGLHVRNAVAQTFLADVLEGFLSNRPTGVTWLMQLRNLLVKPLRLRTSPLGCPVSSLLSTERCNLFQNKYPVLEQSVDARGTYAQVLLGANDRHLRFRSCVSVELVADEARITLATRVHCRNWFGRAYMAAISGVHRNYVTPAMLGMAVQHALELPQAVGASTALAL